MNLSSFPSKTSAQGFHGAATFLRELGYVYARSGQREAALKILEELQELSKKIYTSPYWRAQIYTALTEKDEAFRWLEAEYAERSALMAYLKVDPGSRISMIKLSRACEGFLVPLHCLRLIQVAWRPRSATLPR